MLNAQKSVGQFIAFRIRMVVFILCLGGVWPAYAQTLLFKNQEKSPVSVGLSVGMQAFPGFDVTIQPYPNINLRLAYQHMHFTVADWQSDFGRLPKKVNLDGAFRMSALQIQLERSVWKKWIRVLAGMGFYTQNYFSIKVALAENTTINDLELSPDEVGYGYGRVWWKNKINPFIGLGIGRSIPKTKWNFSADFLWIYKGNPSFNMEATNLVRTNERNEALIEEKLQFIKWIPSFSFRISRRIQ
ncbi:MAG: hypothetical protein KDC24_08000 [Saprospiraceae bacterium]|nr:hypothetical protein [Saprospiraceae bacterium]